MSLFVQDTGDQLPYSFDCRKALQIKDADGNVTGNRIIASFDLDVDNDTLEIMDDPPAAQADGIITFWVKTGSSAGDHHVTLTFQTTDTPPFIKQDVMTIKVKTPLC